MPPNLDRHLLAFELLVDQQNVEDIDIAVLRVMLNIRVVQVAELDGAAALPRVQVDLGDNLGDDAG